MQFSFLFPPFDCTYRNLSFNPKPKHKPACMRIIGWKDKRLVQNFRRITSLLFERIGSAEQLNELNIP